MLQTSDTHGAHMASQRNRRSEQAAMRRLYWVTYPLCLVAVAARRVTLLASGRANRTESSVFAEARSAAYATVGYAFHA